MAVLALAVAGAGAGFYIGVATGAGAAALASDVMMGFSLGAEVGSMVVAASQHYYTADMGRLSDLVVTVASYGTSIPQCWGNNRVPGIVIWGTNLIEHETDVNSGGGGLFGLFGSPKVTTRTYSYTVSMAVALCTGAPNTLNTVQRIYMNDLIVYDTSLASLVGTPPTLVSSSYVYGVAISWGGNSVKIIWQSFGGGHDIINTTGYSFWSNSGVAIGINSIVNYPGLDDPGDTIITLNRQINETEEVIIEYTPGNVQVHLDSMGYIALAAFAIECENLSAYTGGEAVNNANGAWTLAGSPAPRFYQGTETQSADALIISTASNSDLPAGTDNPAFRGVNYFVLQDMQTIDFNDGIPQMSAEISTGPCSVAQVITDVAAQVGINSSFLDVSQVTDIYVTGMMISGRIDGRSALQPILDAYHVDLVDIDGKTVAVPRGGASVATVVFDDMGAKTVGSGSAPSDQRIVKTRTDTLTLPKRIDVGYYSPTIDYQAAVQSAIRQSAPNNIYQSVQYPLTLLDNEAKQLAERLLYVAWVERNGYKSALMPKWAALTPTDIIMLQTDSTGTTRRVRIIDAEVSPAGEIKMEFIADDDSVLVQSQIVASQPGNRVTTNAVVSTNFFAWSGIEINDNDSMTPGFYVAAAGVSNGWSGASVIMSTDGGTTWNTMGAVTNSSVFGSCNAALGDSTYTPDANGFDLSVNQVTVSVNGTLSSLSESNILTGLGNTALITQFNQSISNTSDYELLGFADATLVSSGVYTLSDMLRAQRNTVATGHASDDVFVALTSSIFRASVATALIGQVVQVKCISPGQDIATVAVQSVLIATPTNSAATTITAGLATTSSVTSAIATAATELAGLPIEYNAGTTGGQSLFVAGNGEWVPIYGGFVCSCVVVSTANQSLSGTPTIDGVAITGIDTLVLLTGQTTQSENGPWTVNVGAAGNGVWGRPNQWSSGPYFGGMYLVLVSQGTTYKGTIWYTCSTTSFIVGTNATTWSKY